MRRGLKVGLLFLVAVSAALMSTGCRKHEDRSGKGDEILVTVGDSSLRVADVTALIPYGLSAVDSIAMFDVILDEWIRGMVISEIISTDEDEMRRIERMVDKYRKDLLISEYLKSKRSSIGNLVSESSVKKYYKQHYGELKLESPLVKGIYLKVPEQSERLADLRRWMASGTQRSIDKIESKGLEQAVEYEYFCDRWVDWDELSKLIPYEFYDADAFLSTTVNFETTCDGNVYLLHISGYKLSGSNIPYEFAAPRIEEMLARQNMRKYESDLIRELYKEAEEKGLLKAGAYDPIKGELKGKRGIKV